MKKTSFGIALLLTGLVSCIEGTTEAPGYGGTRTSSLQPDSVNPPGIVLDIGDTLMDEDVDEIIYQTKEWEGAPMDVEL